MADSDSYPILITEDNDDDYECMLEAFTKLPKFKNPIYRCKNGKDLLAYLDRKGQYVDSTLSPTPGIILLDLNMPGTDGRAALKYLNSNSKFKKIPIIVFTISGDQGDISSSYAEGANSYIVKPANVDELAITLQNLKEYWFEICQLPRC